MDAQRLEHNRCVQQIHNNYRFNQGDTLSLDTIKQLCHEQVSKLNFDYVSYIGYYPVCEETHELSTFPTEWSRANQAQYASLRNPIAKLSRTRTSAFFWKDMIAESNQEKANLVDFLARAQQANIHDSVCFPIHGAGAEWGMLNVARSRQLPTLSLDNVQILQLHAMSVHEAVKRASACHVKENSKQKALSPRECECLNWIAAGKTAWETAKIIGVTESTVSFHVRNTIAKLNANNRAQAVAVAMARSLINDPHQDQRQQTQN